MKIFGFFTMVGVASALVPPASISRGTRLASDAGVAEPEKAVVEKSSELSAMLAR